MDSFLSGHIFNALHHGALIHPISIVFNGALTLPIAHVFFSFTIFYLNPGFFMFVLIYLMQFVGLFSHFSISISCTIRLLIKVEPFPHFLFYNFISIEHLNVSLFGLKWYLSLT